MGMVSVSRRTNPKASERVHRVIFTSRETNSVSLERRVHRPWPAYRCATPTPSPLPGVARARGGWMVAHVVPTSLPGSREACKRCRAKCTHTRLLGSTPTRARRGNETLHTDGVEYNGHRRIARGAEWIRSTDCLRRCRYPGAVFFPRCDTYVHRGVHVCGRECTRNTGDRDLHPAPSAIGS